MTYVIKRTDQRGGFVALPRDPGRAPDLKRKDIHKRFNFGVGETLNYEE